MDRRFSAAFRHDRVRLATRTTTKTTRDVCDTDRGNAYALAYDAGARITPNPRQETLKIPS
jgi:hypothetical protein